ncbi:MAG: phage baseplate assembly protein [Afipia sp.]
MGVEAITIVVDGQRYSAFEEIEITAAFNKAARSFRFTVAAELSASATNAIFRVGALVEVFANSDLICRGYVDSRQPEIGPRSATISVAGRSCAGDLIDSSANHQTGRFEDMTPQEIGAELARPFEMATVETDQQLEKIEQYQLTPGETVFSVVERLSRKQGMTLAGTAEGNIRITKAGSARHAGALIEGQNILRGRADHNGANRHSKYEVRGQRPFGHGAEALEIVAMIDDSAIDRYRYALIAHPDDTTKTLAKKLVKNRRDRAAGNALKAQIDVQGFRDDSGKVWEPGHLIWTESPFLDIAQDMLIEEARYAQTDAGSVTTLILTDPRSYGAPGGSDGKGSKGNKSGSVWDRGADPVPYLY